MMSTLYLHIGAPKTGTTSIQNFCVRRREALAKRGYCFPEMPYRVREVGYERNGIFLLHRPNRERAEGNGSVEEVWRRCMAVLSARLREYPNVILSDEGILPGAEFNCPDLWQRLQAEARTRGFNIRVIVYLRRQDLFLQSMWAQWIKVPKDETGRLSWEEMLRQAEKTLPLDYYASLEKIAAVLGRDSIDVRIYERSRFPEGNIINDFLAALGVERGPDLNFDQEMNFSIGGNTLEIRRIVNELPIEDLRMRQRLREITAVCAQMEGERYSMFTEDELRAFLARYERSNRLLARDYLGGEENGFSAPGIQLPKWTPDNPHMYETIIRYFALAMFLPERDGRWKRFKRRLREEIRDLRRQARWRRELRQLLRDER